MGHCYEDVKRKSANMAFRVPFQSYKTKSLLPAFFPHEITLLSDREFPWEFCHIDRAIRLTNMAVAILPSGTNFLSNSK
jgi:hypothetical protein